MTDTDNAYKAKGTSPHEAFDLIAYVRRLGLWRGSPRRLSR